MLKDDSKFFFDFFSRKPEKGWHLRAKVKVPKVVGSAEDVWIFDRGDPHHYNFVVVIGSWPFDETWVKVVEQLEDTRLEGFSQVVDERQVVLIHQNQGFYSLPITLVVSIIVLQKFWKRDYAIFELVISEG